ncbi:glycoside hydrolase superfamily [Scheffersomyces coipomensis]|uniref:glycoside hydrolase superfamily n=1 Tax=Scheffersomyces coipomensis TaxID=1788519 RepID=UPI00315D0820
MRYQSIKSLITILICIISFHVNLISCQIQSEVDYLKHIKQFSHPIAPKYINNTDHKNTHSDNNYQTKTNLDKIYGVSLGGWLVAEPWITPSLFDNIYHQYGTQPVDEYTLATILGKNATKLYMENHWKTFYTEGDFQQIKAFGLNLVRIPVGYWAFGLLPNDPYVQGQEFYLDQALGWCQKYNIQVLIDIHGMPGSQNGFDNSGLRTSDPSWLKYKQNLNLSYTILKYIFTKYGSPNSIYNSVINSIEVVNEPFAPIIDPAKVAEFYTYSYNTANTENVMSDMIYHDGFMGFGYWDWFMPNAAPGKVIIDHHLYEIFSPQQIAMTIDEHLANIMAQGNQMSQEKHPRIVGEFSGALTDCTRYINGVGNGARFNGTFQTNVVTGSCANHTDFALWSSELINNTKRYLIAQFYTYETNSNGWIFWCFKTESAIEWDFKRLAALGMLPSPLFRPRPQSQQQQQNNNLKDIIKQNQSISSLSSNFATKVFNYNSMLLIKDYDFFPKIIYTLFFTCFLFILNFI